MRCLKVPIALLIVCWTAGLHAPAYASTLTNVMRKQCFGDTVEGNLMCISYIMGYIDGYIVGQKYQKNACISANAQTILEQYKAFIDKRPELWGQPAMFTLGGFIELAYPCPK